MKPKIERLSYASDLVKLHEKKMNKLDFRNFDKNIYNDLELGDKKIKKDKGLLNKIKKLAIKDLIYSNRAIPISWRKKFTYRDEMMNIISNDKKFLSYISSSPSKKNFHEKLPKLNAIINQRNKNNTLKEESKSENNILNGKNRCFSSSKKIKSAFKFKSNKRLDNDDIKILLENYRAAFPIRDKVENIEYFYSNNNINKEDSKEKNNINQNIDSSRTGCNSIYLYNYTNKKIFNFKRNYLIKKKNYFRQNIFSLESLKEKNNKFNKINKNKNKGNNYNKIRNKTIEKNLKNINYFGPLFSYCPSCRDKNINFYNKMEPTQCLKLLNYLKNLRKNKKNIDLVPKLSSSVISSDISLINNSKEKETLESEGNNKFDF